jgi:AraC family transcriptional regulator
MRVMTNGLHLVHKRYPAGMRMGRHAHDEWRFCLALGGRYTDSWRHGYRTRTPGHLSLHPAGEVHTSVFHAPTACFHIELTGVWRERLLGDAGIAPEPHEFLDGRVPLIAQQVYREFRHADACSPLVLEGLACELIGWTARASRVDAASPSGPAWLHDLRDLLHDRFAESLALRELAAAVGVHPVHLAREFKRRFGCTVGDYVRGLRVDFVCRELQRGPAAETTLADLALRAGFADQSHLTRVFKRLMGATPREYRARR